MKWKRVTLIPILAGLPIAACQRPEYGKGPESFLEAEWSGQDTAKVSGPATAEWCDSLHLLQIQGFRGDTGVAIVLYPVKQFQAGRFPVAPPAKADSSPPAAAVALRWFAETSIRGFQGDSGVVVVEQTRPGVYAGTFDAKAHSVTDGGRLAIRGSFRELTMRPASRGCTSRQQRPDTGAGVH